MPGFPVGENDRAQNFVVQETHIFSPAVVGVGRFSYLRNKFLYDEHLNHESPSSLGFQCNPHSGSPPALHFIQVGGYASVGDPIAGPRSNRPNVIRNPNSGPKTPLKWFDSAAFQKLVPNPNSPAQQFGNEGRNIVQGPGYANWDFAAVKNIQVMEGKQLQFRGELFNILNRTNPRLPDSDISSPTVGQIHSDVGPRVIQVALKFLF